MALADDKERIIGAIEAYLRSKRDEGKRVIANNCKASIQLALNYRELLAVLEAYREELLRLVDRKNARRWFKHKPGGLDDILKKNIERLRWHADQEATMFSVFASRPEVTVKDWNRNEDAKDGFSGGTDSRERRDSNVGARFIVNGRRFAGGAKSVDDVKEFLRTAGIQSTRIREYLGAYANQDNLFSGGHLFTTMCHVRGIVIIPTGAEHRYENTSRVNRIHCRDAIHFGALASGETRRRLNPPLKFVQIYDLVDDGSEVSIVDGRYEIENIDSLPEELREQVRGAMAPM